MERALTPLLQAGFPPPEATDAFFALYTYTVGFHQMGRVAPLDYAALPPEQIPALTTVSTHLTGAHHRGRFEYGLDTLLTGLRTTHTHSETGQDVLPPTPPRAATDRPATSPSFR